MVRKSRTGRAHIWLKTDTLCRMASTGGINTRRYQIGESSMGLPLCRMCNQVAKREGILE